MKLFHLCYLVHSNLRGPGGFAHFTGSQGLEKGVTGVVNSGNSGVRVLPFTSSVVWGKLLNGLIPHFPHLKMGMGKAIAQW